MLATGSEPRSLPGLEIDGGRVITSDHALKLDHVPASAVILGGGVIGVEFASVWRSFGAEVTIVEMLPHLVPPEDESSSQAARARVPPARHQLPSREPGSPSVKETGSGVTVTLEDGKTHRRRAAAGRRRAAGRSRPGSATRRPGWRWSAASCSVDELLPDQRPDDLGGRRPALPASQLAHVGFAEGIVVAERLAGLPVTPIDYDGVPAGDLQRPRGRLGRHHLGAGGRARHRGRRRSPTTWAATARASSCRPRARRRSSPPRAAARCSASTWWAPGSAS